MKSICLYMHVHQPLRLRELVASDIGTDMMFSEGPQHNSNRTIINKVAEKAYLPTNQKLLELLERYPEFNFSLSITGTLVEQLRLWRPDVLASFQCLVATGRVDIVAETYYHSLAFFHDRSEFESQVSAHREMVKSVFNYEPRVFRNTELAYNNDLAKWAESKGYIGIMAEGWDPILDWRSPNFIYRPPETENIRLLLKNYRLSDDIAFRFSDRSWVQWPLTAEKFVNWVNDSYHGEIINLFLDYETFGEHQWDSTGIMEFLDKLPPQLMNSGENKFVTVTQAATDFEPKDTVDFPYTVTWADTERDLSAWDGNSLQRLATNSVYSLKEAVLRSNDIGLIDCWRKLTTSDHFYYMCTKWFKDGDVHAYFSPYSNPYEAHAYFMMAIHNIRYQLMKRGVI